MAQKNTPPFAPAKRKKRPASDISLPQKRGRARVQCRCQPGQAGPVWVLKRVAFGGLYIRSRRTKDPDPPDVGELPQAPPSGAMNHLPKKDYLWAPHNRQKGQEQSLNTSYFQSHPAACSCTAASFPAQTVVATLFPCRSFPSPVHTIF